jgi:hypothetical protein
MKLLRFIAATLATALCALGLSVGAAMAEGQQQSAKPSRSVAKGLCILHDIPR